MGRKYLNVIDAKTKGSACTFQLPFIPSFALPGIPGLPPIPALPKVPTVNLYCPFDDAEEVVPTS